MTGSDAGIQSRWLRELDDSGRALDAVRASLEEIEQVAESLVAVLRRGGTVLACGNGGSALAAQHFAAEMVGHFRRARGPLRSIALPADGGLVTAIGNDYAFDQIFSRQVQGLGSVNDALLAFSTSGRSPNVLAAVRAAREIGMLSVGFSGGNGGELASLVDHALVIPIDDTARIQEGHLLILHLISERIDAAFADRTQ